MPATLLTYDYNTEITFELLKSIAHDAFPDCAIYKDKMVLAGPTVVIRKSFLVQAKVILLQKPSKNQTVIKIFPEISMKAFLIIGRTLLKRKARMQFGAEVSEKIKNGITERLGIVGSEVLKTFY